MALGDLEDTHGLCSTSLTHGAYPQRKLCFAFQQQGLAEGSQEKQLPPLHPLSSAAEEEGKQKKWEEETGAPKRRVPAPWGPSPNPSSQGPSAAGEVTQAAAAHAVLGDLYRRTGIYQSAV